MKRGDVFFTIALLSEVIIIMLSIFCWVYKAYREDKKAMEKTKERLGAAMCGNLRHMSGLPIERGVLVEVYYGPDRIVFKNDWQEIIVMRDKITHIDLVIPSNGSKAIYRGGRYAKFSSIAPDLVISYTSGGMNKQIKLDTYGGSIGFPKKVVEDFRRTKPPARMTIEL